MGHSARILAASISPDGVPLTSFEVVMPRIVLAEFNTHRMFSRNSASSRAIPVEKMLRMVQEDPYIPTHWGKNQKGMQADFEVDGPTAKQAEAAWLRARDLAVEMASELLDCGIHKQITNRLLEPFMWHTVIVTATEWSNFFHLRNNPAAHPDIQVIAEMMQELYEDARRPEEVPYGKWHTPLLCYADVLDACSRLDGKKLVKGDDYANVPRELLSARVEALLAKVSIARCARVSLLTHEGKRDLDEDVGLHDKLLVAGHMSPFEHVARPASSEDAILCSARTCDLWVNDHDDLEVAPGYQWYGNFRGWVQYRKLIPHEDDILNPRNHTVAS
jgi:Thymidylate synthase complementing protein